MEKDDNDDVMVVGVLGIRDRISRDDFAVNSSLKMGS